MHRFLQSLEPEFGGGNWNLGATAENVSFNTACEIAPPTGNTDSQPSVNTIVRLLARHLESQVVTSVRCTRMCPSKQRERGGT